MCKSFQIKIIGKVQGVWFRKYTNDKAKELGLFGFVKNQADGSVYVEAESDSETVLQQFIDWLRTGSPLSKVERVNAVGQDCQYFDKFEIR